MFHLSTITQVCNMLKWSTWYCHVFRWYSILWFISKYHLLLFCGVALNANTQSCITITQQRVQISTHTHTHTLTSWKHAWNTDSRGPSTHTLTAKLISSTESQHTAQLNVKSLLITTCSLFNTRTHSVTSLY